MLTERERERERKRFFFYDNADDTAYIKSVLVHTHDKGMSIL